jgi:hypothetical protein
VCILLTITNQIPKLLSTHKSNCLELFQLDIAGPFPPSIHGNCYFILIIDSYTNINWIIPLKYISNASALMKTWIAEVELAIEDKIFATRTDHALELI